MSVRLAMIAAGVALAAFLWFRGEHFRNLAIEGAFRSDSLEATNDTTRRLLFGDLVLAQRRIVQHKLQIDSLDKALKQSSAARAGVTVVVRSVDTVAVAQVTGDSIRRADFTVNDTPFHTQLSVALPAPPDSGTVALRIRLDPASIGIRVVCGEPVHGVRPATLGLLTPDWLTATVDSAQVVPTVCHPGLNSRTRSWFQQATRAVEIGAVTFVVIKVAQALF